MQAPVARTLEPSNRPERAYLRICMVSDFFHPALGGVEMHIYQLAQCLLQRGHKVVVVTHLYGRRQGVRYMSNGLKVYYLPFKPLVPPAATIPTLFTFFPLLRKVLIRERIDVVHGHQATSALAHECIFHARTMGIRTVYTDHSNFSFNDTASIHVNKLLKFFLTNAQHAICVSHCNKENLVLRAELPPLEVSVIPNAVDASRFVPDVSCRASPPIVNVVVISRLAYRKGTDLLVDVVPAICQRHPHVRWIIGGDGPKRILLEEMVKRERLHDRVELLGAVPHSSVRDVLVRGHVFLNTSLTEAFCIAIVEAAACGLLVISTNVGGVPEVLPPHMVRLAAARPEAITDALSFALQELPSAEEATNFHEQVGQMYSWHDVAQRTERVYRRVMAAPRQRLRARLLRFLRVGPVSGKIFLLVAALDFLIWRLLEWLQPADDVEIAHELPRFPTDGTEQSQQAEHVFREGFARVDAPD